MWSPLDNNPSRVVETAAIPLANTSPSSAPSIATNFAATASELTLDNLAYSIVC